jgi:hypothetical protein
MSVECVCCVLSVRGLCDELITHPEESNRRWCVVVCDLETSGMRRPWPTGGCCAKWKKCWYAVLCCAVSYHHPVGWWWCVCRPHCTEVELQKECCVAGRHTTTTQLDGDTTQHSTSTRFTQHYIAEIILSVWRSCDSASWQISYNKPIRCKNFSNLFWKEDSDPACKLSENLYDTYHCCVYSEKLLMMDRGAVRNM